MTAQVEHWRATDDAMPSQGWKRNFAVIDPDDYGAIIVVREHVFTMVLTLANRGAAAKAAAALLLESTGAVVVVVESQYMARSAAAAIDIGRNAGEIVGMIAAYCDCRVEAIAMAPATWQSRLRVDAKIPREALVKGRLERKQVKHYAAALVPDEVRQARAWRESTAKYREGISDAVAITRAWVNL